MEIEKHYRAKPHIELGILGDTKEDEDIVLAAISSLLHKKYPMVPVRCFCSGEYKGFGSLTYSKFEGCYCCPVLKREVKNLDGVRVSMPRAIVSDKELGW